MATQKEQQDKVCNIVHKWMVEHKCHSAEHASQNDECNIDAIDLVCDLAEIVGIPYEYENNRRETTCLIIIARAV